MAPVIHLIRHAQGYHNLEPESSNKNILDADLTPAGADACRAFASRPKLSQEFGGVELVCASPLKRTLRTALLSLEPVLAKDADGRPVRILALPDAQEANADPCNTGSSVAELRQTFAESQIDLSEVEQAPDWCSNQGRFGVLRGEIEERARRLRRWLRARPEREIVIVGHGMFWHFVTGDIQAPAGEGSFSDGPEVWFTQQTGPYWRNLLWRTFEFASSASADEADVAEAKLVETEASRHRMQEQESI